MAQLELFAPDFLAKARNELDRDGRLVVADGDFHAIVLDADRHDLAVLDCTADGLIDGVARLTKPPAAVMNAQFIASPWKRRPEGQVVRGGQLVVKDARPRRWYIAQVDDAPGMDRFRIGSGDPSTSEPRALDAIGGLGPLLHRGRSSSSSEAWAQSIYRRAPSTGRGLVAIDRSRHLILLLVQRDQHQEGGAMVNGRGFAALQTWLVAQGVDDALFNDGSDSEALALDGRWLVRPATRKSEATGYALAFTAHAVGRRSWFLAIDGTPTADASTVATTLADARSMLYPPQNLAPLARRRRWPLSDTVGYGVVQTWRLASTTGARSFQNIIASARFGTQPIDLLYVSGHAERHGTLVYHRHGGLAGPAYSIASPWDPTFKPAWGEHPRWIILAGCAVLALRYSRLVALNEGEITGLIARHRDIHGPKATIPGLRGKRLAWQTYHPGWAWYTRILRDSSVRGILGYWYRSPGAKGGDVEIIADFATRLVAGEPFLAAWRAANQRGLFGSSAAWAAMVRSGAENDTLATLGDVRISAERGDFAYHDDFQDGVAMASALHRANRADQYHRLGRILISTQSFYDRVTLKNDVPKVAGLAEQISDAEMLMYDDGTI